MSIKDDKGKDHKIFSRPTKENAVVDQRLPFSSPPAKQSRASQPIKREAKKEMTGEQELAILELARTLGRYHYWFQIHIFFRPTFDVSQILGKRLSWRGWVK